MFIYFIVYVVGLFDSVELIGLLVLGKVYVLKGYVDKMKFVVKYMLEIFVFLEVFFDIKYLYKKLDFVVVLNFIYGVMENVGLIIYCDSLLLLEDNFFLIECLGLLNIIVYELVYQWFGNLVIMEWWDDLWFNEVFVFWVVSYIMMELYLELNFVDCIV